MAGIISQAEFKAWRGITGTGFDTSIDMLIPIAQSVIESMTGTKFDANTYTEVFNGDGTQEIVVGAHAISSITSIKTDFQSTSPTTLDSTTYAHDGDRTISRLPRDNGQRFGVDEVGRLNDPLVPSVPVFDLGFQNIQVVYIAGHATDDMPKDLKLAMYRLIDTYFETRGEDLIYIQNKGDSGSTRAMRTVAESDATILSIINEYRRAV